MKGFVSLFPFILAILLAILVIRVKLMRPEDVRPDMAGLGVGTSAYFPKKNNLPIQADSIHLVEKLKQNLQINGRGAQLTLWMGNSQIFGINQYEEGQVNCVETLHDSLISKHIFVMAYAMPNANLQEQLVVFEFLLTQLPVKRLIIPVFFDDTRESGIRDNLLNPAVKIAAADIFDTSDLGRSLLASFQNVSDSSANSDMKALDHTTQQNVEKYLDEKASGFSTLWKERGDIRSNLIYNYLFKLRNTAFGIDPDTKRKKIDARYRLNLAAFEKICALARAKNIEVLVYIPPIRDDVEQPYILREYEDFKADIGALRAIYGFTLINAESLVPAKLWGMKAPTTISKQKLEMDFMHFKAAGHKLLADTIKSAILKTQAGK